MKGVTFINTCSSEYVEIYVGTGPKKVRENFKLARSSKPAILFIDELESIGVQRSHSYSNYTNNLERNSTLNQLLVEMDGIENNSGILVIAATNREDLLDPALIRPGRFDVKINFELPSLKERIELFKLYCGKYDTNKLNEDFANQLGKESEGLSGAIIEDIVNKTASISFYKKESILDKDVLLNTLKKSREESKKFKYYEEKNKNFS